MCPTRRADGPVQLLARDILEQVTGRTCLDGTQNVGICVIGGQHQYLRFGLPNLDLCDCGHAIHLGHPQVHQDHVRA
jgi:hypothetical protein